MTVTLLMIAVSAIATRLACVAARAKPAPVPLRKKRDDASPKF